jgi:DNA-binding transcriptional MerR regulator
MSEPITSSTAAHIVIEISGHNCPESSIRYYADRGRLEYVRLPSGIRLYEFDPVRARAVRMATAAGELANDVPEVVRTRDLEEVPPARFDVVHVQQPRRH